MDGTALRKSCRSWLPLLCVVVLALLPQPGLPATENPDAEKGDRNTQPECWITSPEPGVYVDGQITVVVGYKGREVGAGHTAVIQEVAVYLNGSLLGSQDIVPAQHEGEASVSVDLSQYPDGEYSLQARAFQGSHEGLSPTISILIDRTPPGAPMPRLRYGCATALTIEWPAPTDLFGGQAVSVAQQEMRFSDHPFS